MEVIILAGGLGTRLRSEVRDVPKCMAPIAGKPFLLYLLNYLKRYKDVKRVILSVGYLREAIVEWISTVKHTYPFKIDYAIEKEPLGTGGGIRLAMEMITGEEALILNGDTFFSIDLNALVMAHNSRSNSKLTIALKKMTDFDRYGTVVTDTSGRVLEFKEKEFCKEGQINGGIYCLSKDECIFEGLPKKFSFELSIMQNICGKDGCVYGLLQDGYFIDIGIPEDYHRANIDFQKFIF